MARVWLGGPLHGARRRLGLLAAAGLLGSACAPPPFSGPTPSPVHPVLPGAADPRAPLTEAIRRGSDLGSIAADTFLHLDLTLAGRDPRGLEALLAGGHHVSPAVYAQRYGPDPAAAEGVLATLAAAGIRADRVAGTATLAARGSATAIERFFGVAIHDFVAPDGTRFHAPVHGVDVPGSLRPAVVSATGFDNYPLGRLATIRSVDGLRPEDARRFYNMDPLRQAGLDGGGITVVFPETTVPQQEVMDKYAQKFNLPAFHIEVKTDPSMGDPVDVTTDKGKQADVEAEMDVEIVHAIAPAARLIVYAGQGGEKEPAMLQLIARDQPGAIVSSSIGINTCESGELHDIELALDAGWQAMAAVGITAYDASGDYGAYCDPGKLGIYPDVASPHVTAVGGTTVFQATDGGYFKETAWGEPVSQGATGGGVSSVFAKPSWQTGPGVDNQFSNGHRQAPDISGNADPISGWDIFSLAGEGSGGGTSAAAPLWSGITALIAQDLKRKNLPQLGFIAPMLYAFGQKPAGMPGYPYHEITQGTNLYHPATPGWNYATGWGSPDVGRLTDAIEWFQQNHPQGAQP